MQKLYPTLWFPPVRQTFPRAARGALPSPALRSLSSAPGTPWQALTPSAASAPPSPVAPRSRSACGSLPARPIRWSHARLLQGVCSQSRGGTNAFVFSIRAQHVPCHPCVRNTPFARRSSGLSRLCGWNEDAVKVCGLLIPQLHHRQQLATGNIHDANPRGLPHRSMWHGRRRLWPA